MKMKTVNIMKHLNAKGQVIIKMDKASGIASRTITKRANGVFVVGENPRHQLTTFTTSQVEFILDRDAIFIEGWK